MATTLVVAEAGDADLGLIRAVAAGRALSIGPDLLAAVQQRCTQARQALGDGRTVYGVNTGMGALSSVHLTEQQQPGGWPPRARGRLVPVLHTRFESVFDDGRFSGKIIEILERRPR
jgi:hypothetical protein